MIIEKERNYTVIQTFTADNTCNQNEYTVYDYNQNAVGYFIKDLSDNTFEIYHNATEDFEDYDSIDYADNYDEALSIILSEIDYDMN
jgi:predicted kinase